MSASALEVAETDGAVFALTVLLPVRLVWSRTELSSRLPDSSLREAAGGGAAVGSGDAPRMASCTGGGGVVAEDKLASS